MYSKLTAGNRIHIASCVLCLLVGGIGGHLLFPKLDSAAASGDAPPQTDARVGRPVASSSRYEMRTGWEDVAARTKADSKESRNDDLVAVPASLLSKMSGFRAVRNLSQPLLDDRDPVDAALGLTMEEKDRIQNAWQGTRDELRRVEIALMRSEDLEDGSVRLSLPDMSSQGKQLADRFRTTLTTALGPDRGEALFAIKQIDELLSAKAGPRSVAILVEPVGEGRWGYRMTLEDNSGKRVWVGANIPDELRHLADAAGIFHTVAEAAQVDAIGSGVDP